MNSQRTDVAALATSQTIDLPRLTDRDDGMPIIDVQAALTRMGGDRSLVEDIARFFLEDAPGLMAQVDAAVQSGNADEVAHGAHTLKGLASNFNAGQVVKRAAEIEQLARAGRIREIAALVDDLAQSVSRVESALRIEVLDRA